jgi:nitrogen fixation protein FixH
MRPSSTAPAMSRAAAPRKALWIPAVFVCFMLTVVAVNGTMIFFAQSTFSGLDTTRYYEQGVDYNAVLQASAVSAALGWSAKAEYAGNRLTLKMADKAGKPLNGLKVEVHLVRPTTTAFDQVLTLLASSEPGFYSAGLKLAGAGAWELRISATGGAAPWQATQRIFVK